MIVTFLAAAGVLMIVVGLWFGIYYFLTPHVKEPDGMSRVTGTCGDTMELRIKFKNNKVEDISEWTDGCIFSVNCLHAAANLARGKTPDEALDIDYQAIQKAIGGLPKDHIHCATLAAATLNEAVSNYMKKLSSSIESIPSVSRIDKGPASRQNKTDIKAAG